MKLLPMHWTLLLGLPLVALQPAFALPFECGQLTSSFGPFDYRTISPSDRQLVEGAHFLPKVESLKEGNTARLPGADIAYTLAVMPNHPRALLSMERLSTKEHTQHPWGSRYSAECYFLRGIEFARTDPMPHLLYASFLKNRNRKGEAIQEAQQAESLRGDPTSYELDYNLGLLYFDLGMIEKARKFADSAYALGAELPGLKRKIDSVEPRRR